jgi:hypothetical protein
MITEGMLQDSMNSKMNILSKKWGVRQGAWEKLMS